MSKQSQRPPIGLVSRDIHDSDRFTKVCAAINRYYNAGLKIPIKWVKEYNDLVVKILNNKNLSRKQKKVDEDESEKELEERTDRNMNLISDFCAHLESENIVIPESAILSFFNA